MDAVAVPNDGPLLKRLSQQNNTTRIHASNVKTDAGLLEAWDLLGSNHGTNDNDNENENDILSATVNIHAKTIQKLKQAKSLREQLSILRAYRSTILNYKGNTIGKGQKHVNIIGVYRFLIEFGFSNGTPHALKRASESCLSALAALAQECDESESQSDEINININISCKDVQEAVVQSILKSNIHVIVNVNVNVNEAYRGQELEHEHEHEHEHEQEGMWKNPVQTLFDVLSFAPTLELVLDCKSHIIHGLELLILEGSNVQGVVSDYYHNMDDSTNAKDNATDNTPTVVGVVGLHVMKAVEKGVEICNTLKLLLKDEEGRLISSSLAYTEFRDELHRALMTLLECVVLPLIRCKATSADALSVLTVTLGQVLLLIWILNDADDVEIARQAKNLVCGVTGQGTDCDTDAVLGGPTIVDIVSIALKGLPQLNQIALVKGMAATLPDGVLATSVTDGDFTSASSNILLIDPITLFILRIADVSTENGARLLALKGLETALGRWKTILVLDETPASANNVELCEQARILSDKVLRVALATWESPPSRQIGSAVPGLFQSLVKLMGVLDQGVVGKTKSIDVLVRRVLAQPSTRKGKYVALEALLPKVGASKLIELAEAPLSGSSSSSSSSSSLISSFLSEIGRRGNSSGVVAELLGKLISMLRVEMHKGAGIDLCEHQEGNKKERRKLQKIKRQAKEDTVSTEKVVEEEQIMLLEGWNKLWAPPLAAALLGSDASSRINVASFCLPLLIAFVGGKSSRVDASHAFAILLDEVSSQGDDDANNCDVEAILWAKFEIVRHAQNMKLLKLNACSVVLAKAIATALPLALVKTTLFHESDRLRLAAFLSLSSILFTHDETPLSALDCLILEADLWKEALPYSFKCSDKEYIGSLTQALRFLLDRLSDAEAKDENTYDSHLLRFVNSFLLRDIFVQQGAYPGTVSEKEKWSLSMIDCLVSFASNEPTTLAKEKKISKHAQVRRLLPKQEEWCRDVMVSVLSDDVIATLLCLMNSMWDGTRSSAYGVLLDVLEYAKEHELMIPITLSNIESAKLFQSRAFHLASSPRQREADTGARMISVLCTTQSTRKDQFNFLEELSKLLLRRVIMMRSSLGILHSNDTDAFSAKDETLELPLAHGLVQAIRLIVQRTTFEDIPNADALYHSMTRICFQAIEVSLVVVADIKEDNSDSPSADKGSDEDTWKNARSKKGKNVPLNVNTGAIGANATFSSLDLIDDNEKKMRLHKQRVVMGTWLLIKEACAALSSIAVSAPVKDAGLFTIAGNLLISTLTSLKHQGAAFAAHKSLQKLCSICYSGIRQANDIRYLPSDWSEKLLHGISSVELVRDSTLRRSTGYGLGFLSILRSEQVSPSLLFPHILSNIIRLSLPATSAMEMQLQKWSSSDREMFVYSKTIASEGIESFVPDSCYQARSRVHALNILRLVILDAPLASEMRAFVGDSIISSLIGYKDSSWAIRNSATMCFAAAMLRVVDADKNADMALGNMNDKRTTSAVTCKELFRNYPPLATSLLSLIKEENANALFQDSLHPTLFPLLLLLARLQPLSMQRAQAGDDEASKHFVDPIIDCLGHVHHKVRLAAARALVVLCSGDSDYEDATNSRRDILNKCTQKLSIFAPKFERVSHNQDHGILLAIKFLLGSSTQPDKFVEGRLEEAISYYATWCKFTLASPPFCTSAALDAWHIVSPNYVSAFNIDRADTSTLLDTAFKVVRCVEYLCRRTVPSTGMVGLSDLGKAASNIASRIAFIRIFELSCSSEDRIRCIQIVQHCFESYNYDVMLHSVKSFKKGVYDAVEDLCRSQSCEISVKREILSAVAKLAFKCLSNILCRDKNCTHPPTLRRLSRIALEAIHALNITCINAGTASRVTDLIEVSAPELWKIASVLLYSSGYDMTGAAEVKPENLSGGNGLAGNALEFASFAVSAMSVNKAYVSHAELAGFVETFVSLIDQSTHPLSSWKIRYSAAVAMQESGLVQMSNENCRKIGPRIEESKLQLCLKLLELFQDSDEDVRRTAGRSVSISRNKILAPKVSLMNLEQVSLRLTREYSTLKMYNLLLSRLVSLCCDVQSKLSTAIKEYECTLQAPKPDEILNLSTERKIFEEEDPNPYEETLVIIQIAIVRLTEFPLDYGRSKSASDLFATLNTSFKAALGHMILILKTINQCPDIVHNVTFDGNLFVSLHGLILGSAFSLWIGVGDETIIALAKEVTAMNTVTLHPCISQALRTLVAVREQNMASLERIREGCFLLPRKHHSQRDFDRN